jgi:ABC-type lipoprotein release transport system permease subunit
MRIPLKYNLRNLLVRKVTTLMTVLGISLVVATFVALMAMAHGLDRTLVSTGLPENVVLLRKGAVADAASSVTIEQYMAVRDLPQVRIDGQDRGLVSPELVFQILRRKRDGGESNVILRGVRPVAFAVHSEVRPSGGSALFGRAGHLLVGRGVAARYRGLEVGSKIRLFHRDYTVVGTFECKGGYYESEIWCDLDDLMSDSRRSYFSAVYVKLRGPELVSDFKRRVDSEPRINLEPKREIDYFEEQSENARGLRAIGLAVAVLMAIGAVFAAMNTMYAAISSRTKEIGTLRALGFSRWAVTVSFVVESVLLAVPGGFLGCLLAIPVDGMTTGTMNMRSFADVTFSFTISMPIVVSAVAFSMAIGFFGGLLPARMGASIPIVRALREV